MSSDAAADTTTTEDRATRRTPHVLAPNVAADYCDDPILDPFLDRRNCRAPGPFVSTVSRSLLFLIVPSERLLVAC
jgi:hypothetical protein